MYLTSINSFISLSNRFVFARTPALPPWELDVPPGMDRMDEHNAIRKELRRQNMWPKDLQMEMAQSKMDRMREKESARLAAETKMINLLNNKHERAESIKKAMVVIKKKVRKLLRERNGDKKSVDEHDVNKFIAEGGEISPDRIYDDDSDAMPSDAKALGKDMRRKPSGIDMDRIFEKDALEQAELLREKNLKVKELRQQRSREESEQFAEQLDSFEPYEKTETAEEGEDKSPKSNKRKRWQQLQEQKTRQNSSPTRQAPEADVGTGILSGAPKLTKDLLRQLPKKKKEIGSELSSSESESSEESSSEESEEEDSNVQEDGSGQPDNNNSSSEGDGTSSAPSEARGNEHQESSSSYTESEASSVSTTTKFFREMQAEGYHNTANEADEAVVSESENSDTCAQQQNVNTTNIRSQDDLSSSSPSDSTSQQNSESRDNIDTNRYFDGQHRMEAPSSPESSQDVEEDAYNQNNQDSPSLAKTGEKRIRRDFSPKFRAQKKVQESISPADRNLSHVDYKPTSPNDHAKKKRNDKVFEKAYVKLLKEERDKKYAHEKEARENPELIEDRHNDELMKKANNLLESEKSYLKVLKHFPPSTFRNLHRHRTPFPLAILEKKQDNSSSTKEAGIYYMKKPPTSYQNEHLDLLHRNEDFSEAVDMDYYNGVALSPAEGFQQQSIIRTFFGKTSPTQELLFTNNSVWIRRPDKCSVAGFYDLGESHFHHHMGIMQNGNRVQISVCPDFEDANLNFCCPNQRQVVIGMIGTVEEIPESERDNIHHGHGHHEHSNSGMGDDKIMLQSSLAMDEFQKAAIEVRALTASHLHGDHCEITPCRIRISHLVVDVLVEGRDRVSDCEENSSDNSRTDDEEAQQKREERAMKKKYAGKKIKGAFEAGSISGDAWSSPNKMDERTKKGFTLFKAIAKFHKQKAQRDFMTQSEAQQREEDFKDIVKKRSSERRFAEHETICEVLVDVSNQDITGIVNVGLNNAAGAGITWTCGGHRFKHFHKQVHHRDDAETRSETEHVNRRHAEMLKSKLIEANSEMYTAKFKQENRDVAIGFITFPLLNELFARTWLRRPQHTHLAGKWKKKSAEQNAREEVRRRRESLSLINSKYDHGTTSSKSSHEGHDQHPHEDSIFDDFLNSSSSYANKVYNSHNEKDLLENKTFIMLSQEGNTFTVDSVLQHAKSSESSDFHETKRSLASGVCYNSGDVCLFFKFQDKTVSLTGKMVSQDKILWEDGKTWERIDNFNAERAHLSIHWRRNEEEVKVCKTGIAAAKRKFNAFAQESKDHFLAEKTRRLHKKHTAFCGILDNIVTKIEMEKLSDLFPELKKRPQPNHEKRNHHHKIVKADPAALNHHLLWLMFQVHRVFLNDETLLHLDLSNFALPHPHEEKRILPKLLEGLQTNTHLKNLELRNCALPNGIEEDIAHVFRANSALKIVDISINPGLHLHAICPGLAQNRSIEMIRLGRIDAHTASQVALNANKTKFGDAENLTRQQFEEKAEHALITAVKFNSSLLKVDASGWLHKSSESAIKKQCDRNRNLRKKRAQEKRFYSVKSRVLDQVLHNRHHVHKVGAHGSFEKHAPEGVKEGLKEPNCQYAK